MEVISDNLTPSVMRKNILKLSWPAILRLFLQSLVGTADIIMVGHLGQSAIGAVGVSNRIVFIILGVFTALSIGSTALVAHYIGAKDHEKGNTVLSQSLIISILLAIIFTFIGLLFSKEMLSGMLILMEKPDQFILNEGSIYIQIVLASMLFGFPLMVINAVFQGIGDMKTPLFLMILTNITNVIFNYLFIFGYGAFPQLGVAGAGIGSAIGRFVGCFVGVFILIKGKSHLRLTLKYLKFDSNIIKKIFKIGIPSSIEQFSRQSSQIIITILVAGLGAGTAALAANEIAMNVNMLSIMPGFGFSVAAVTLVGQSLGANKKELAESYAKQSTYLATVLIIPASVIMFMFAHPLAMIYNQESEVLPMAVIAIRIIVVTQPILAIVMVLAGALRGAGDTKWVLYITVVGNWAARVALGYLLGFYFKFGLVGVWLAIAIDILVRAVLSVIRFNSGKWKNITVISKKEQLKHLLD